jgi:lysyl-tRNA synthetase class 2
LVIDCKIAVIHYEYWPVTGRILSIRSSSTSLHFYDLHGDGVKIQVFAELRCSGLNETEYGKLHAGIKRGDIVGIEGFPGKSKTGELSIFPSSIEVLSYCLHMLPKGQASAANAAGKSQHAKHKESVVPEAWRPGVPRNLDRYILKDQVNRSAYDPGVSRYFYDSLPRTLGRILYEKLGADELSRE